MYYIEYSRLKYFLYTVLCFVLLVTCIILIGTGHLSELRKLYVYGLMLIFLIGLFYFISNFISPNVFMSISPTDFNIKVNGYPTITFPYEAIVLVYNSTEYIKEKKHSLFKTKKHFLHVVVTNELIIQKQVAFRKRDTFRKQLLEKEKTFKMPVEMTSYKTEDILHYIGLYIPDRVNANGKT